jgi:hypothetical protein
VAGQTHHHRSDTDPSDHRLSMQGPDPQEFYPGKVADRALAQRIKDTYGDVEKGKRGYKVASIQNAICLACQLIIGKLVRKNRPTQVTRFRC